MPRSSRSRSPGVGPRHVASSSRSSDVSSHTVDLSALFVGHGDDIDVTPESVVGALRHRYGLRVPDVGALLPLVFSDQLSDVEVALALGLRVPHESLPNNYVPVVCHALVNFLADQLPSASICDLVPGSVPSVPFASGRFRITALSYGQGFLLDTVVADVNDAPWKLWFPRLVSAVEVLRRGWGPSKLDVVNELSRRGVEFATLTFRPWPPVQSLPPHLCFPVAFFGYKPTKDDYARYETSRERILRGSRGRVALMKGGIVWRLAVETLGLEQLFTDPNVFAPVQFQIPVVGGTLVDDDLSDDELAMICGVHCIINSKFIRNKFKIIWVLDRLTQLVDHSLRSGVSDSSWWPKYSTWRGSGFDYGYWTWDNELWFRERRAHVQAGNAGVKTAGQWKASLKGCRKGVKLRAAVETHTLQAFYRSQAHP